MDNFVGLGELPGKESAVLESEPDSPVDSAVDSPVDSDGPPEPMPLCLNEFMPDNQSVLALEDGSTPDWIEIHNPTDEHYVLTGWGISDDVEDSSPWILGDVVVPAGGYTVLYADGLPEAGVEHVGFRLSASGGDLVLWAPDGRGQVIHYGTVGADFSVSRIPDCCIGDGCLDFVFRGTPGETNDQLVEVPVFEAGSEWQYYDASEAPAGWQTTDFNAAEWSSGSGDFGFGEPVRNTEVASGAADDRTPTIYFRRLFELSEVPVGGVIELNVDDGAVVWVNGEEAVRRNLPEGEITHLTWASESVGDGAESSFTTYELDAALFISGFNVVAVEVHQAAATSSDLGFDLSLSTMEWRSPDQ
ncbi:MAG: lamin tail domain-containing protein [Proteobacteria bacterium]|nr:lamin tail domain-containing protein [Pseudomonadota bacterium]